MSEHNNSIKLALWESLQIDSLLSKSDLVIFIETDIRKYSKSLRATSFCHVLFDDFISQFWWAYMFLFNNESNFKDVVNSLNCETQKDYKQLNIFLLSNKSAIDNTSQMSELNQLMHLNCEETVYALLITMFYFVLSSILSELPEDQISCIRTIWCCLLDQVIVELLK